MKRTLFSYSVGCFLIGLTGLAWIGSSIGLGFGELSLLYRGTALIAGSVGIVLVCAAFYLAQIALTRSEISLRVGEGNETEVERGKIYIAGTYSRSSDEPQPEFYVLVKTATSTVDLTPFRVDFGAMKPIFFCGHKVAAKTVISIEVVSTCNKVTEIGICAWLLRTEKRG